MDTRDEENPKAGLTFAVWTAANLVPRARAHHAWYRRTFEDYPANRKALPGRARK